MRNLIFIIALGFFYQINAQNLIKINDAGSAESSYDPEKLIEEVLISGACATISNVTSKVEGAPNELKDKSYGYFERGDATNFPFEKGIILSTGKAYSTVADLPTMGDSFFSGGDLDLEKALAGVLEGRESQDATFFKFNFTPNVKDFSFRFIMASQEYRSDIYVCGKYNDGFAFLLRPVGSNNYQNLAILPNNDLVSVKTINNVKNRPNCIKNEEYFVGEPTQTLFKGRTIPLTAKAEVIPGQEYEIKLIVADIQDSQLNSTIFLEAGSFNIGGGLGDDITIEAGTAVCYGKQQKISTGQNASVIHEWTLTKPDGSTIVLGETGPDLIATEPGTYSVEIKFNDKNCISKDSILVEFIDGVAVKQTKDLTSCIEDAELDLTVNTTLVLGDQSPDNAIVRYFESEAAANAGTPEITDPTKFKATNGQNIFVRIESKTDNECYDIGSFKITIDAPKVDFTMKANCDGALVDNAPITTGGTYSFTPADPGDGALINTTTGEVTNATPGTTYKIKYAITGSCAAEATFDVTIIKNLDINTPTPLETCDNLAPNDDGFANFTLTDKDNEITNANANYKVTYHKSQNDADTGANPLTSPYKNEITKEQLVYVLVVDTQTSCTTTTTLSLKVTDNPDASFEMKATCSGATVSVTPSTPGGTFSLIPAPTDNTIINPNTGEITNATPGATYTVNYKINGSCPAEATATVTLPDSVTIFDPEPLELCDDLPIDGFTTFNLNSKNDEITGGNPYTVSYHKTQNDADAGINPLNNPYTNEIKDKQTVYALVTDANGCQATTTLELVVIKNATASFQIIPNCEGATVTNTTPDGGTFSFETPPTDNAIINPSTGEIANTTPGATYSVTYSLTGNCNTSTTQQVTIPNTPNAVKPNDIILCDDANDSDSIQTFDLTSVIPTVTAGNNTLTVLFFETQQEAKNDSNPIANPSAYQNKPNGNNLQTIYIRVSNSDNCSAYTTMGIKVNSLPVVNIEDQYIICEDTDESDALIINTGLNESDYDFVWINSGNGQTVSTTNSFKPKEAGIYSVTVTHKQTQCTSSDITTVLLSTPPILSANVTGVEFSKNQSIKVVASSSGTASKYEFSLDGGAWASNTPNNNTYYFKNVTPGIRTIKAREVNGCGISETSVLVLSYPYFFTPNNDGYHDTWQISGIEYLPEAQIRIFDRYGNLIKQINNLEESWDGTLNGKQMPSTDYWFTIEYFDTNTNATKQFKAHFALKR